MPTYYLYLLDSQGHIRRRLDLDCENDDAAIAEAEACGDGGEMELWLEGRRVRLFHRRGWSPGES